MQLAIYFRYPIKYKIEINAVSQQYQIDKDLIYAVVWTESKFKKDAKSSAGAVGLMQLMPTTAKWCSEKLKIEWDENKLLEPEYNLNLGVYYLKYLLSKFDLDYALSAYNAGEGNVRIWLDNGGEILFKETQDYVKRVNTAKNIYLKYRNT